MDAYQHLRLLQRHQRLRALRSVIFNTVKPGFRVLDAGSGAGVLSIWAAQAGASEVLGIDLEAVPLAQALAIENGVQDRVHFMHGDLECLDPDDLGQFDVILALLYLNDPRRDASQAELVASVQERFLAPGGTLIPDSVIHTGVLVDWPSQNHEARLVALREAIAAVESSAQLGMKALDDAIRNGVFVPWFPPKRSGRYAENDYRPLSDRLVLPHIDYSKPLLPIPRMMEVGITDTGTATAMIWTQQLISGDVVLFENESLSWLQRPMPVTRGSTRRIGLGTEWTERNVLTLIKDAP